MRRSRRDARSARCASARAYLEGLDGEPRVVHPLAATPFTFGIVTSSFGDTVVIDDRASMVEALHERVLALLGEPPDAEPVPEMPPMDSRGQPTLVPLR